MYTENFTVLEEQKNSTRAKGKNLNEGRTATGSDNYWRIKDTRRGYIILIQYDY